MATRPRSSAGAPRRMRYLILTRKGENLGSTFVTLLEPYDRQPFIRRAPAGRWSRPPQAPTRGRGGDARR